MDLIGKTTAAGWKITQPVIHGADHTGGYFSSCFNVERGDEKAFLKALDIEKFDIGQLSDLVSAFEYETRLVHLCRERRLRRIVQVLDSGTIERDHAVPLLRKVPYLVFEVANAGDIRPTVDVSKAVNDEWRFFVLHQTAAALMQLHKEAIAHQDLKPSNVLRFSGEVLKLGDLGRSSLRGVAAPHDSLPCAGALNYAPFEQRYSYEVADWVERRLTTDVFHLGCLATYVFTNIVLPQYVMQRLPSAYSPEHWGGPYVDVLPHIRSAFVAAVGELSGDFPARYRSDLEALVLDLCDPDPAKRGRVALGPNRSPDLLWLQRVTSKLDALEKASRLRR